MIFNQIQLYHGSEDEIEGNLRFAMVGDITELIARDLLLVKGGSNPCVVFKLSPSSESYLRIYDKIRLEIQQGVLKAAGDVQPVARSFLLMRRNITAQALSFAAMKEMGVRPISVENDLLSSVPKCI
jgi:hypothetical protein